MEGEMVAVSLPSTWNSGCNIGGYCPGQQYEAAQGKNFEGKKKVPPPRPLLELFRKTAVSNLEFDQSHEIDTLLLQLGPGHLQWSPLAKVPV